MPSKKEQELQRRLDNVFAKAINRNSQAIMTNLTGSSPQTWTDLATQAYMALVEQAKPEKMKTDYELRGSTRGNVKRFHKAIARVEARNR